MFIIALTILWGGSAVHAEPILDPSGPGVCEVISTMGETNDDSPYDKETFGMTFIDALNKASNNLCGLDSVFNFSTDAQANWDLAQSSLPVTISLRKLTTEKTISLSAEYDRTPLIFVPLISLPAEQRRLHIVGFPSTIIKSGCFSVENGLRLKTISLQGQSRGTVENAAGEPDYFSTPCRADYGTRSFVQFNTSWPVDLDTLYMKPIRLLQGPAGPKLQEFSSALGPDISFFENDGLQVSLHAVFLDITSPLPTDVTMDGLHLPLNGTVTVRRLITNFDPYSKQTPIRYLSLAGDTVAPVNAPVPSATDITLTRNGNTLTLKGKIPAGVTRIEAYRPPKNSVQEYWKKYFTPSATKLNWSLMAKEGVFVEWTNPDPSKSGTFTIKDLPIYTMQDFSQCEWLNCKKHSNDSACAYGRGYVVTVFDAQNRPSMITLSKSYGSESDFRVIRKACALAEQDTSPVVITNNSCASTQSVQDNFCEPLNCAADAIAEDHVCKTCPSNQTAKNGQCVPKTCPIGKKLNSAGACVAIECAAGEVLKSNLCICDAAHGYSKDFATGACVLDGEIEGGGDGSEGEGEGEEGDGNGDNGGDGLLDGETSDECAPGLVRYGTFCIKLATCPPGTERKTDFGGCYPITEQDPAPYAPPLPGETPSLPNTPSGGCSLIQ